MKTFRLVAADIVAFSSRARLRATLISACAGVLIAGGVAGAAPAAATDPQSAKLEVIRKAIDGYIRPSYGGFAAAAGDMDDSQSALCATPSREALLEARKDFGALVTAFSRIEFVRFGPVMEDNRIERILFWPDRRGVALRQVQAILAAKEEEATDPETLKAKSVAVQGLNALEFALFGAGADALATPDGTFRCRYGAAVTGNLSTMAQEIADGWQADDGIARSLLEPSASSPAYRSIDDSLQELTGVFVHGFEAIRDLRIQPAFGDAVENTNPKAWIYQRSGLTDASLHADFAGLSELFDASGIADLAPEPQRWIKASIAFEFGNAGRTFQTIGVPVAEAAGDPARRDRVGYLLILTQSLQSLFADQLAPSLGITAGFSALDGD